MRRSEAVRIARRMERHLERQWLLGRQLQQAAEDGCPVAKAAYAAVDNETLPHPITDVEGVVREALGLPRRPAGGGGTR